MNLIQRLEYMAKTDPRNEKCAQAAIEEIMGLRQKHMETISKLKWVVNEYNELLSSHIELFNKTTGAPTAEGE